jgi:hypothetical protein
MPKRQTQFDVDEASMDKELAECADRDEAIKELAPELVIALKSAVRLLLVDGVVNLIPDYAWHNEYDALIEPIYNKLICVEDHHCTG